MGTPYIYPFFSAVWPIGITDRGTGTDDTAIDARQLWMLEEHHQHKGYYYIHNVVNDGYRLSNWDGRECHLIDNYNTIDDCYYNYRGYEQAVSAVNTIRDTKQLWRFEYVGGGNYRIYNFYYPSNKLSMTDKWKIWADGGAKSLPLSELNGADVGYLSVDMGVYNDAQLWSLERRFSAKIDRKVLFHIDNRSGTQDITETRTEVEGFASSKESSSSTTTGFEASLTVAASYGIASAEASFSMSHEMSQSMTKAIEQSTSVERTNTYTAPAGFDYRVSYIQMSFSSNIAEDRVAISQSTKCVEQSTSRLPDQLPMECPGVTVTP